MSETESAADRIQNLIVDMVMVLEKYKDESEKVTGNVQRELDKSLSQQRKMMVEMVRDDLLKNASEHVKSYTKEMGNARQQMVDQVGEFNAYLKAVKNENQKIFRLTVVSLAGTLATLVIGGVALFFFYSNIVSEKKLEADMLTLINNADIVRCGENLCAKTGKAGANGYRIVQKR